MYYVQTDRIERNYNRHEYINIHDIYGNYKPRRFAGGARVVNTGTEKLQGRLKGPSSRELCLIVQGSVSELVLHS